MDKFDYKKEYKELYLPKTKPTLIQVPEITFLMFDGSGDPNTSASYKNAMEVLYGLSYSIKMSKMNNSQPEGYFEYVVPPLEGLWWADNPAYNDKKIVDKDKFLWTSMIRQPEFVTEEVFKKNKDVLQRKKKDIDLSTVRLVKYTEGLCCQIMHIGPYDDEAASIEQMDQFILDSGYVTDITKQRWHHEIYLTNPLKTAPEKLKTVIRHPIKKLENQ